jgi:hypothetical protein
MDKNNINDSVISGTDSICDDSQSAFEELIRESLLLEEINNKKAEIFENVVFEGSKRFYIEDLSQRDYSLENTCPHRMEILGNVIETSSWGELIEKIIPCLLTAYPEYKSNIVSFKTDWSKAVMFSVDRKTNFRQIYDDLFVNCNHTALHSCWFIQDLLDFFKINKSKVLLLIHRPSSAEPKKVKDYVEKRFKREFKNFLVFQYNKDEEYADKVIRNIDKYLNPILAKISKSYNNFYLFDSNLTLSNYSKKVREKIDASLKFDDKAKKTLNRYIDYIIEYYKK